MQAIHDEMNVALQCEGDLDPFTPPDWPEPTTSTPVRSATEVIAMKLGLNDPRMTGEEVVTLIRQALPMLRCPERYSELERARAARRLAIAIAIPTDCQRTDSPPALVTDPECRCTDGYEPGAAL